MLASELLLQAKRSAGGLPHYFLLLYEALPDAGLSGPGSSRGRPVRAEQPPPVGGCLAGGSLKRRHRNYPSDPSTPEQSVVF